MTPAALAAVMEATWPPAGRFAVSGFTLRDGAGGGKRVSAATALPGWTAANLQEAETSMQAMGQEPLFLIRAEDEMLDSTLAARGYAIVDPVVAYAIAATALPAPPWMTTFPHWPPMAIAREQWAAAGIGPARLAVMDRVSGRKTAILARAGDRIAGVAFVALHEETAMLHALEVTPSQRRKGAAQNILAAAAAWTHDNGGSRLVLVVTQANQAARALYENSGMQMVGAYHYRQRLASDGGAAP
jgi:GNAT superfamily N-acetyltransferase